MKNTALLILLFLSCCCNVTLAQKSETNWTGSWGTKPSGISSLILDLKQNLDSVKGGYCSVMDLGKYIDCDVNTSGMIDSVLTGVSDHSDTLMLELKKPDADNAGMARLIRISDRSITWELIRRPSGDFHLPGKVTLYRKD